MLIRRAPRDSISTMRLTVTSGLYFQKTFDIYRGGRTARLSYPRSG